MESSKTFAMRDVTDVITTVRRGNSGQSSSVKRAEV